MKLLYFDTCCLNRPWDDQSQLQVHLEAEAVIYLLEEVRIGNLEMVTSDYLLEEILRIPEPQRRTDVLDTTLSALLHVAQNANIKRRAKELASHDIKGYDALHLAAAEAAGVDYFLTTDQRFLKGALRASNLLRIKVINPTHWPSSLD